MTLWDQYFEYHPDILLRIESIDKLSKGKFIKKLKLEKDKENFLSTIAEFQFYEFLINEGFSVDFEKEYVLNSGETKLTPDFTILKDSQSIIVEVVKLNTTEKDRIRNDFENYLLEGVEKNAAKCCVKLTLENEYFDAQLYDKELIVSEVSKWLSSNLELEAELILHENFRFRILSIDEKYEHTYVVSNFNSIDIDTRRLNSDNSRFVNKIEKYTSLIDELRMPYLICIKIDFHAGINENELFWTMYGDLLFHEYVPKLESELNGLYYKNEVAKRNLSGVLLMINNQFKYYNNYFLQNRLRTSIKKDFLRYQFFGETYNRLVYLSKITK